MTDIPQLLERAVALHQAGRTDEAEALYGEILSVDPNHADARHLRALIAHQAGRHEDALAGIDAAIGANDAVSMYHANRGRVLKALGRDDQAASAFSRALGLDPGNPATLSDLSGALVDAGRAPEAMLFAERVTELAPGFAPGHYNHGLTLNALGRAGEASEAFNRAIELDDAFAPAHFELASIRQAEEAFGLAEKHYRKALAADPGFHEARANLGNVLRANYRLEEAVKCFRDILPKMSGEAAATLRGNLGVALQEMGDLEGALAAYDEALSVLLDDAEIHRNRAQALLQLGRFEEGWREFEWRWRTRHFDAIRRDWPTPQWRGGDRRDGTVLIHSEQGFGDCIQFARYLPLVAERVGRVVIECPAPLAALMARVPGVDDVITPGTPLPRHDAHSPMMSLPGLFGTTFENMPADVPYLEVRAPEKAVWASRVGGGDAVKVGIVWKGSHKHQRNAWRSPGLEALRPLTAIDGVHLVSLQKDDEAQDLSLSGLEGEVVPLGQTFRNFNDTAAAIANLDLVIAPDTAVAHLAGALAVPVWLMLPHASEWRWFTVRDDSPWYPTMKLFRQSVRGDWVDVVGRMRKRISEMS